MNLQPLKDDLTDDDLTHKLFPELKTLGGIVAGVALTFCFGDISHSTREFAQNPTLWRTLQLVFRPGLVIICWMYFMRTLAYNKRVRSGFFWLLIGSLVAAAVAQFALAGVPLFPDRLYYALHPEVIHLVELSTVAMAAFFACIAGANAMNWGRIETYDAMQARAACVNATSFAGGLLLMAAGLALPNILIWIAGLICTATTFIASIRMRSRWHATHPRHKAA